MYLPRILPCLKSTVIAFNYIRQRWKKKKPQHWIWMPLRLRSNKGHVLKSLYRVLYYRASRLTQSGTRASTNSNPSPSQDSNERMRFTTESTGIILNSTISINIFNWKLKIATAGKKRHVSCVKTTMRHDKPQDCVYCKPLVALLLKQLQRMLEHRAAHMSYILFWSCSQQEHGALWILLTCHPLFVFTALCKGSEPVNRDHRASHLTWTSPIWCPLCPSISCLCLEI